MAHHAPSTIPRRFGSPGLGIARPRAVGPPPALDWVRVGAWAGAVVVSLAAWAGIVIAILALTA